jgi:hypothetical protein
VTLLNPYFELHEELKGEPERHQLALRKKLIWAYSWAIPNSEAIEALKELSPLIEIGAGTGYWAWLLRQAGASVVALDRNPKAPPHWSLVEQGTEEDVKNYPTHTLFLCWPSYQEEGAARALKNYSGLYVAYVGEWGGRTADQTFHDRLKDSFFLEREIQIPVWPGYSDRLYLFKRRS